MKLVTQVTLKCLLNENKQKKCKLKIDLVCDEKKYFEVTK